MQTLKSVTISALFIVGALWFMVNGALGLIAPSTWMRSHWTVKRGFNEKDLNSIGGRLKILVLNSVFLAGGLALLFLGSYAVVHLLFKGQKT